MNAKVTKTRNESPEAVTIMKRLSDYSRMKRKRKDMKHWKARRAQFFFGLTLSTCTT